jgi:DNA-binding MarR family transcriptional regulator
MMETKYLEGIVKGFSNHRRIKIIFYLAKNHERSLEEISLDLHINIKTASEHVRRLAQAGLVRKKYEGKQVKHSLTALGWDILTFLRMLIRNKKR